ncbi:PAS domain S-box protein [Rhizobium binxianense]
MSQNSQIPGWMLERWQELLSSLIEITTAETGRVLQVRDGGLEVICAVGLDATPGRRFPLSTRGGFPASVVTRASSLEIPDGGADHQWDRDADEDVASYLGMPIRWPDEAIYGVMDINSRSEIHISDVHRRLMTRLRDSVEEHLLLIWEYATTIGSISRLARRSGEALLVSEERFRLLVENALDDFFLHDDKGRFLDMNARACTSLGYTRKELLQMSAIDVSTDLTQEEKEKIWRQMQPGTAATVYSHHRRKDGSTFPVEVRISCHFINGRKLFLGLVRDITERVEAEQALRRLTADLERRVVERTQQLRNTTDTLQAVMDGANDAIFLKDTGGRLLLFNHAAERMSGWKSRDVLGKTAEDVFGKEAGEKIRGVEARVLEAGETVTVEETLPMPNGHRVFLATRSPYKDENGNVIGLIGISRDITDRKSAETELQIERNRLALAAEVIGLGVWDYDIGSNTLYCDPQWYRIVGRDLADPIRSIEDIRPHIHPDDVEHATTVELTTLKELVARHQNYGIVFRIVRPGGEVRWVRSAACLIENASGIPNRAIGVIVDITEAYLADQKLQTSYQSLRQAEKLARIGSWTLDLKTGAFSSSEMLYEMNGADPGGPALTIDDLRRLLSPESYAKVSNAIEHCARTGEAYGIDAEHMRSDGSRFAVHIRGQAVRNAEGSIVALTGTVQDISEREEARAQLAALADNVPDGAIYRLEQRPDGTHAFAYFSAGIERLTGVSADAIVANPESFERIVHEEDLDAYLADLAQAFADRQIFDSRFRANTSDGTLIHMHSRAVPRQQSDGNMVWDGIIRDITAERRAAEFLAQAKAVAEAAGRAKSDFLATMSHEIRTPMNSVIGMTRLALRTELSPKLRNYLEKIDSSARTLLDIINDILDFSKIEAGGLELEDGVFQLEEVLDAVSNATALRAEEKGLEIVYSVAPDVPRIIRGDSLRLSQILINLVGNAVKFTDEGDIVIAVALVQKKAEAGGQLLQFSVRDTGIGLSSEQIAGLFRPFTQADADTSKRYGGTGLGLSICKQLVEKMGGTIGVESMPGEGSLFHFTILLQATTETSPEDSARARSLRGRRVLVVDDNDSARAILSDMVASFGMATTSVASAPEALAELHAASRQNVPYHLVLMDWRMPEIDGLEAARRIRSDPDLRHMPAVLMVTAYGRDEVLQQMEALNLQGLLIKPITESTMFNTIQHIFAAADDADTVSTVVSRFPADNGLVSAEILKRLSGRRVLVVDDNVLNREVVTDFLMLAGVSVVTAASGIQALEELKRQSFDAVLMDLHMPEMDGLEVTRRIRQHPDWASLPIVALTAQARTEDRDATLDAGMVAHLSKPIDEHLLYNTLVDIFAGISPTDSLQSKDEQERLNPQVPFDLEAALAGLGGNPDRYRRLLDGFLRDFTDMSNRVDTAYRSGRLDDLAALAHLIKGPAGYLHAFSLARSADRLEHSARSNGTTEAIGIHVEEFVMQLDEVLQAVRRTLALSADGSAVHSHETAEIAQAFVLLDEIEPLIVKGDYAATPLLRRLAKILVGYEEASIVEKIQTFHDDLELDAAGDAIAALRRHLRNGVKGPQTHG